MKVSDGILKTITRYGMLNKGDRVLVAVSGGPDSVCLLHMLWRLQNRLGTTLYIAHMDHGVRGRDSRRDAEFVKNLAKSLGLKISFKRLALGNKKSKLSLEERLREKRYDFLKASARKFNANIIATAHTLDDQAETVLMRLVKGTSLKGIVGIHPVRFDNGMKFVRPLIEIEKKAIKKQLKDDGIPFCVDKTNLENKFLRNKIRNQVLPYLEKINPQAKRSLFNLAESLWEDFQFLDKEIRKRSIIFKSKNKSSGCIMLGDILLQPKAIQKEIVRHALKNINANIKKLTFRHWKEIDYFIRAQTAGKSLHLPGGVTVRKAVDRIIFAG